MKLDFYLSEVTKVNLKWIKALNIKCEIIYYYNIGLKFETKNSIKSCSFVQKKILEKNIMMSSLTSVLAIIFLDMIANAPATKVKRK